MVLVRRIFLYFVLTVLLLMVLVWGFSPMAVRMLAAKSLAEQGLELDGGSKVRLNLFNSTLTVRNLKLRAEQKEVVSLDQLTVEYRLWRLLLKQVQVKRFELNELTILAENSTAGLSVAGINLNQAADETAPIEPTELDTTEPKSEQPSRLAFDVNLPSIELNKLKMVYINEQQQHEFNIEKLALKKTQLNQQAGGGLLLKSELVISNIRARNNDTGTVLASLGRFDSGKVQITLAGPNVTFASEQIRFEELVASHNLQQEQPALVAIDFIELNQLSASPEELNLAQLRIGEGDVSVNIDDSGELLTLVDFQSLIPANTSASSNTLEPIEAESQPAAPMTIRLKQLILSETVNIKIDDQQNSHGFSKAFELHQLEVNDLDSSQPEQPTTLALGLKDADYFTLQTDGTLQPFLANPKVDLVSQVREFPLNEIAPYLKDSLGFEVLSGQLDADINAHVAEDQLDSEVVLFLRGANFASSDKPEESNLIGKTAIPLNVALNMLKDGDGNIKLKVPIKGDVTDPSFGMQHILGLVVKKVVLAQAKDYLMTTFVPYAKVVSVAFAAGEQALKVRLEDLPYQANQIAPQAEQIEFAAQLGQLMTDKPSLVVNVCGVARADEAIAAQPAKGEITATAALAAPAISIERARSFKDYLVQNYAIESSRLLTCSDQVEEKEKAEPRIEFKVL